MFLNNVWGDDFGPHARRRSVKEKLARGLTPTNDEQHLDEVFDMEAELKELCLDVCNTRLQLSRHAMAEEAALVSFKNARDLANRLIRRTRDCLSIPVDDDLTYRLENASAKMKSTVMELEEELNHLLRLLRSCRGLTIPPELLDDEPRPKRRNPVKKSLPEKGARSTQSSAAPGSTSGAAGDAPVVPEDDHASVLGGAASAAPVEDFNKDETLQAFLFKKKKDKGGQKKRWIVCNATSLIYYDKRDGKELGRLALAGCKAVAKKDDDGAHMVLDSNEGSYVFTFIPSTEEQPTIDMWCEFIMKRAGAAQPPRPALSGSTSSGPLPAASTSGGGGGAGAGAGAGGGGGGGESTNSSVAEHNTSGTGEDVDLSLVMGGGSSTALPKSEMVSSTPENESIEMFFAGYLLKRKEKNGKFSSPKRRYCVLEGATLKYLEKKGGNELGSMQVSDMTITQVSTEDGDCLMMKINGDSYSFSSDQAPYISDWTKKLLEQGAQKGETEALTDGIDGLSAYLNKKKDKGNGKFTAAKKRWCICDGRCLTYYEKKGAPELGSLSLNGCTVSLKNDDDGSWVMILKTEDAQHLFGNIDGSSMQPWVDFIQKKTGKSPSSSNSGSAPQAAAPSLPVRRERATLMVPNKSASTSAVIEDGTATVARRRRVGPEAPDFRSGSAEGITTAAGSVSPAGSPRGEAPKPAIRTSPRTRPAAAAAPSPPNPVAAGRGTTRATIRERSNPMIQTPAAPAAPTAQADEFGI